MFVLSPSVETTTASASSMPALAQDVDVHAVPEDELAGPAFAEARERVLLLVDRRDLPTLAEQLPRDGRADPAAADHDRLHDIRVSDAILFPAPSPARPRPSSSIRPSPRRSLTMSQWIALSFVPPRSGKPLADGEVDRAVDLLVEERVLHVARDAGVAADPELAEPARAVVGVEHLEQEVLVRARGRLDDAGRRAKRKRIAVHLAARVDGRETRRTRSFPPRCPRPGSRRPRRRACSRRRRRSCPPAAQADAQVGPRADDAHLARRRRRAP